MNQPNPDTLARQAPSQYDNLSDDELRRLINDAARITGLQGNVQPQRQPNSGGYIDYDAKFGHKA